MQKSPRVLGGGVSPGQSPGSADAERNTRGGKPGMYQAQGCRRCRRGPRPGLGWRGQAVGAPAGLNGAEHQDPVRSQRLFSPPQEDRRQELSCEMSHGPGEETTQITRPGGTDSPPSGRRWGADGTVEHPPAGGETALVCWGHPRAQHTCSDSSPLTTVPQARRAVH